MAQRLQSQGFLVIALLTIVVVSIYTQFEIQIEERPAGDVADLKTLAERDDLNVVFIMIDTLRADRMSAYGYERETTPVMSYLAETGIRFGDHHSQSSWTKASMASLWTGLNPSRIGVKRAQDALPFDAPLSAEKFKSGGYETIGIWRNGWVAPNFGFGRGFDAYHNPHSGPMPGGLRKEVRSGRIGSSDFEVVQSTNEFLRTHVDKRFFLYVHLMDVHQYVSHVETAIFGNRYSDSYDNSVLWTDRQIGGVIAEIERLGLRDRTVIAVVSDHGEAFGEHATEGHARDLYAETTTTPFILSLPFQLSPGIVVEERTSNVDVFPTLLDMLGLESLGETNGESLMPILLGERVGLDDDRLYVAYLDRTWGKVNRAPDPIVALARGDFRLIRSIAKGNPSRLYNLRDDPGEQLDVSSEEPERLARLDADLDAYLEEGELFGSVPQVELSDLELKQLKALGYEVE